MPMKGCSQAMRGSGVPRTLENTPASSGVLEVLSLCCIWNLELITLPPHRCSSTEPMQG